MSEPVSSAIYQIEIGLDAANDANHEFDVWKRVQRAASNFDDSSPEGISPEQVHENFIAKVAFGGVFIGRESGAEMTAQGLQPRSQAAQAELDVSRRPVPFPTRPDESDPSSF